MKHIRPNLSIQFYLRLLVKLSSMIDENYSYPYYNTYNQKKSNQEWSRIWRWINGWIKKQDQKLTAIKLVFSSIHKKTKQSITISCTDDKINDFKEVNKNWKVFSLFKKDDVKLFLPRIIQPD